MVDKLREQIDEQVSKKGVVLVSAEQFYLTLAGSCLFPFAARPMMTQVLGFSSRQFTELLEERRRHLPVVLKRALQLTAEA